MTNETNETNKTNETNETNEANEAKWTNEAKWANEAIKTTGDSSFEHLKPASLFLLQ